MRPKSTFSSRKNCQGMTLVEVLVAAVVIAIGLMGVAALQVAALQGSSNSQYRSRATDLASSLADRIRANLTAIDAYRLTPHGGSCTNRAASAISICAMAPDETTTANVDNCTADDLAAYDLWEVRCALDAGLPQPQIIVTCPAVPDLVPCPPLSPLQISIIWQVQNTTAGFTTEQVSNTIVPGVML
ncbi:MAG: type IV pilus modification protein PilV [Candidatus Thiodiazotropha sp. (ex Lucinoma borealis)]|nr:type IV pilus modification protein PilV [Candidatus Thiodiazotropha sp. (ex Lucinoma borealis)]